MPHVQYLILDSENCTKNTADFPLSNATDLAKFGSSMKNI
jgi:hypothetical protein